MFSLIGDKKQQIPSPETMNNEDDDEEVEEDNQEIFEVGEILSICYGLPEGQKDVGLYFKVLKMF